MDGYLYVSNDAIGNAPFMNRPDRASTLSALRHLPDPPRSSIGPIPLRRAHHKREVFMPSRTPNAFRIAFSVGARTPGPRGSDTRGSGPTVRRELRVMVITTEAKATGHAVVEMP
jgi:hypothetical protein